MMRKKTESGRLDIIRLLVEHPVDPCRVTQRHVNAAKSRGHAAAVDLLEQFRG
jgi:hypothetical protein